MSRPQKVALPKNSKIEALADKSYFHDAWRVKAAMPELDPLEQFIRVMRAAPKYLDSMMIARNNIVSLFGLKNLGAFSDIDVSKPSTAYKVGERVGIFTLIESNQEEVLLGDNDSHLKVVVSMHKNTSENAESFITVSTVVHVKNWLGKAYMLPVAPAHYFIAKKFTELVGKAA